MRRTALGVVLSGGGARGAYEAGVLSYVSGELAAKAGRVPSFEIVAGTSIGAVNGAFLAATAEDPRAGARALVELWRRFELRDVLRFGVSQAGALHKVVFGGRGEVGVFDPAPMRKIVSEHIPWDRLHDNLARGRVQAFSVSATHVAKGHSVIFVELAPGVGPPVGLGAKVEVRPTAIVPSHVLASSSIPVVFPPVRIDGELYCEGGLRLNTPMSPAIKMGADRLLVVSVSSLPAQGAPAGLPEGRTPGLSFLLGKVLNAFLLDHVTADLDHLEATNQLLEDGLAAYGPGFIERLGREAAARGHRPSRVVRTAVVRPGVDIGRLCADYLRSHRARIDRAIGRTLLRALDVGEGADADLASYLLFDGDLIRALIELGRDDAAARSDELSDLFFGD